MHSIRQEGAALRTVVSSTARTTVHGAAGREAVRIGCRCRTPPLPESTLGTPDDANDTEGAHSIAHSIRLHGAVGDPVGSQLRAEKAAPVREFWGFAGRRRRAEGVTAKRECIGGRV